MSEFQYYEFYSVDRELTRVEREAVDQLSSRFSPTARRAVFTYSYSDFRHDPESILFSYFDFFFYVSSWGTKRIMFRLPDTLVDDKTLKMYTVDFQGAYMDNGIRVFKRSKFVLIDIHLSEEVGGMWIDEDQNQLSAELRGLRQDLLEGDHRCLFIIWLHIKAMEYHFGQLAADFEVPLQLIPDNLSSTNTRLDSLIDFYGVDVDWIAAAAHYSHDSRDSQDIYIENLRQLPIEKKDEYLLRVLRGEANLSLLLRRELEALQEKGQFPKRRKGVIALSQLLSQVEAATFKRLEKERKETEEAHRRKMEKMAREKNVILREIDYHIEKGSGKSYQAAVERILLLRDLAIYQQQEPQFNTWLRELKARVIGKPALHRRLQENNL